MESSASRTAPSFGFHVLPTAMRIFPGSEAICFFGAIVLGWEKKIHGQFRELRKTHLEKGISPKRNALLQPLSSATRLTYSGPQPRFWLSSLVVSCIFALQPNSRERACTFGQYCLRGMAGTASPRSARLAQWGVDSFS